MGLTMVERKAVTRTIANRYKRGQGGSPLACRAERSPPPVATGLAYNFHRRIEAKA
jgi:hypothetical protein